MTVVPSSLGMPVGSSTSSSLSSSRHNSVSDEPSVDLKSVHRKLAFLKARAFLLTFISYAIYSGSRQAFGITKETLSPDSKHPNQPGYAPFNDKEWGSTYIGAVYTIFLACYAAGLFVTGPLGDRLNLRLFLGIGMLGSGFFCFAFGAAWLLGVHHFAWFVAANVGFGLFQATGWPGCVTVVTRWFGQGNRGTIMGQSRECSDSRKSCSIGWHWSCADFSAVGLLSGARQACGTRTPRSETSSAS